MTCCTLGSRPDIDVITKAMLPVDQGGEGLTVRAVAERFEIGKTRVERHWQCLKELGHKPNPKAPPPPPERKPESERRPKTADKTQDSEQDKTAAEPVETRQDTQDSGTTTASGDARAQSSSEDESTFRSRTWIVADMIAADQYDGRKTNLELAAKFGCSVGCVQNYVRVAGMLVSKDRNSLEVQREVSLAKLTTIRQGALDKTKPLRIECFACEAKTTIDVAAPDYKAAVAAQKHMDEISGVLVKQPPSVQVTVNPAFSQLWGALSKMLEAKHPTAYQDCTQLLARLEDNLRRRDTIDMVTDEAPMLEAG